MAAYAYLEGSSRPMAGIVDIRVRWHHDVAMSRIFPHLLPTTLISALSFATSCQSEVANEYNAALSIEKLRL